MNTQTTRTRPALQVIQGNPALEDDDVDPTMMKFVTDHIKAGAAERDEIYEARRAAGMPPPVMMPEAFSDYMIEFWASLRSAHMLFLSNEAKRRGRALTEKEKDELSTGFINKFTEGRKKHKPGWAEAYDYWDEQLVLLQGHPKGSQRIAERKRASAHMK